MNSECRQSNQGGLPKVQSCGTGRVLHNFAVQHMFAASCFAREAKSIEQTYEGSGFGPHVDEIGWHVTGAIMSCIASVEAHLNEILHSSVNSEELDQFQGREPLLERHNLYLRYKSREPFPKGEGTAQSLCDVIALRNGLVHFSPEHYDEQVSHRKICLRLAGKFDASPFVDANEPIFPLGFKSHACAKWAVLSSITFCDDFAKRLGRKSKFQKFSEKLGCD